MSGTGRVRALQAKNEPKTNRGALLILTDYAAPIGPDGLCRNAIWIADDGPRPEVGTLISWGPHHVWWEGTKIRKLGNECDPADPKLYTG